MLSTRVNQRVGAGVATTSSSRTAIPARRCVVQASTEQATTTEAPPAAQQEDSSLPPVDFQPSQAAQTGYVAFDSAGQTNMYPVITKAYEVPIGGDTSTETSATNNTALIAGGLALVLIGLGLGALTSGSGSDVTAAQDFLALTQYAAKFATEL